MNLTRQGKARKDKENAPMEGLSYQLVSKRLSIVNEADVLHILQDGEP